MSYKNREKSYWCILDNIYADTDVAQYRANKTALPIYQSGSCVFLCLTKAVANMLLQPAGAKKATTQLSVI